MAYIKFTRANGYYIGTAEVENGHFYGKGATIDKMVRNVRQNVWRIKGAGYRFYLDSKPSETEQMNLEWMPKRLKKLLITKKEKEMQETIETTETTKEKRKYAKQPKTEKEYKYVEKDGMLIVYEITKVAEYKIAKTND